MTHHALKMRQLIPSL